MRASGSQLLLGCSDLVAQGGSLIKFVFAVIAILPHVVQKHLHLALTFKRLTPMGQLNSFVDQGVSWVQFHRDGLAIAFEIEWPNVWRIVTERHRATYST